jgi:diguanylate cyclase (GGDEF)-like protein
MSRLSIQAQITLLGGLLAILLVMATVAGSGYLATQRETVVAEEHMHRLAGRMARALSRGMFERYREIGLHARIEPLRDVWLGDRERARAILDGLQKPLPEYAWIGFATTDGVVRAATQGMLEGEQVGSRPWFQSGLKGAFVGDVHPAVLLASLLRPHSDDQPFHFVDVAAPVHDDHGNVVGVLGAHLSWAWAEGLRETLITPELAGRGADLWILSASGDLLLGPEIKGAPFDAERVAAMRRLGTGVFVDRDHGEPMVTGFAVAEPYRGFPGLDWIALARQPSSIAFATAWERVQTLALIGVATALAGLLLVAVLGRKLGRPLRVLTRAADRIGRDPAATMLPRVVGSREIELLSGALRSLLRRSGEAEREVTATREQRAIERRQHNEDVDRLRALADTDPLTGLLNRRAFERVAADAMQHFRRYGRGLGVLVLDIDHFKKVNDQFGHAAGDDVIQHVADILSRNVRAPDRIARVGGEEFVALLHEVVCDSVGLIAERMRGEAERSYVCRDSEVIKVTLSIGATVAVHADRDMEDVIARADAALYEAKRTGRNKVVCQAEAAGAPEVVKAA